MFLFIKYLCSVRNADFEAFDALLMDSESQKADSDSEYGQVEPRMMNPMEAMKPRNQLPSLPSHLLHKVGMKSCAYIYMNSWLVVCLSYIIYFKLYTHIDNLLSLRYC